MKGTLWYNKKSREYAICISANTDGWLEIQFIDGSKFFMHVREVHEQFEQITLPTEAIK